MKERFLEKYETTFAWCSLLVVVLVAGYVNQFLGDSLLMTILSGLVGLVGAVLFMIATIVIETTIYALIDIVKK